MICIYVWVRGRSFPSGFFLRLTHKRANNQAIYVLFGGSCRVLICSMMRSILPNNNKIINSATTTTNYYHRTSRRFTMKPGVSPQLTGTFPMDLVKSTMVWKTCSSVCTVLITSTNFIICTGLKKCRPTKRFGLPEAAIVSSRKVIIIQSQISN